MDPPNPDIKEVTMEVAVSATGGQEGGGRRRRRGRKTQKGGGAEQGDGVIGGVGDVAVEKMPPPAVAVSVSVKPAVSPAVAPVVAPTVVTQTGGAAPKVVIAPPKKRPAKLLLVPSVKTAAASNRTAALQKTFKAHRVRVLIDNTAKTQKRRRQTLQAVEAMTEEQLRAAAVAARLSRRETVEKVPVELLRQMLKDYRMMRGMLL